MAGAAQSRGSTSTTAKSPKLDASMRIVVLKGKERFLHLEYTKILREALEATLGDIETFEFDGRSVEPADVLDELRSYGLMQQHKLVIVDNADMFISAGGADADEESGSGSRGASRRGLLEKYADKPVEDATLLLRAMTWRPGKLDKKITASGGTIVPCDAIKPEKAVAWCIGRCSKRYQAEIDRKAALLLVDRVGVHLDRLDQELSKLATYAGPGGTINIEHIGELTSPTSEEVGWVIQEAVLTGDSGHALRKLGELLDVATVDYEPLAWSLMDLMRKCHAATSMLRQGMPAGVVAKELKLWGGARDAVLRLGRTHTPAEMASLFDYAVQSDGRVKRGLGNKRRTLEATTLLLADTIESRA